ncbi:hypothetical protein [Amycolatopsis rifamycinica]|uniref:Uncharacterized protein n=1 Tax=Amycolatopsis rifamycinica TaxID=287986 RepID=A0A066TRC3_9PSEU|nr:hypothetical protein [Amycolatopsis rifamycinica]KDN17666.1 hypothetical protein DV20_34900 [Amycolatopsis rifamycinica]
MPDIMAGHGHEWAKTVAKAAKIGDHPYGWTTCSAGDGLAWCAAMMPKRVVAAVLVAALVLAGGGILAGLFF